MKEEDVRKAIQMVKHSLETRSSTLQLDTKEESSAGENRFESIQMDIYKERMNNKLYLSTLRDAVKEDSLPTIVINDNDLLF